MKEKYLTLLNKQIGKLADQDFDLDAWKSSTLYVLKMIFGAKDQKIKEIDELKIDYSSWALRDSRSDYKPVEMCKKKGREILEVARDEIEIFGVPKSKNSAEDKLREILSNSQYEKFIMENATEKEKTDVLKSLTKDKLLQLCKIIYL